MENKIFLWLHMHQPDYLESLTNRVVLPWVRRHSLNGYYSVPKLLEKSDFKANINFSGILLEQIIRYQKGMIDTYQIIEDKDPGDLSLAELNFMLERFLVPFSFKNARYNEIKEKARHNQKLSKEEIFDFQTIFKLSAFAPIDEEVIELRKKGRDYTKEDKETLQRLENKIINSLFDLYKNLLNKNQIEITVTPYHHPILPLLIDINSAKVSKPTANIPDLKTGFIDDARFHIEKSLQLAKEIFGIDPSGVWPAEGSVSYETVEMLKESNVKWIGSDEALVKDLGLSQGIYNYKGMKMFLRNHSVSDKIGFVYNKIPPKEAIEDLKKEVQKNKNLILILDGENPWESFDNYGIDFLNALFNSFSSEETLLGSEETSTVNLTQFKPGSWINGFFDTWIGDEESNKAWTYLIEARNHITSTDGLNEILKAEASDYFWWYSDFHKKEVGFEFDSIFRGRLIRAYIEDKKEVPGYLILPIKKSC